MKLLEFYSNLKDKIEDDDIVKENFQMIFNKYKKGVNSNKEMIEELEKKFFAGEKFNIAKPSKNANNNQVNKKKKIGVKRTFSKMKNQDDDSASVESENVVDSRFNSLKKLNNRNNNQANNLGNNLNFGGSGRMNTRNTGRERKAMIVESDSQDDNFDDEYDE